MSTKQNVPTVVVQDYEYGTDGQPLVNTEVTVRLAVSQALVSAGITGGAAVNIEPIEARVKTDANGFWSIPNIVRNSDITPSGTVYTVKVGLIRQYLIQVPAGAGPFTASAILVGALPFFPQGSSVAGPITITGNLTVTGSGTFGGALQANAGLAVLGGGNVSGGWTIAGLLTMSDAASRLVPGATSFSIRDNANANDNLIVTNAGNVTIRGTLATGGALTVPSGGANVTGGVTAATGDVAVTAGRVTFGSAAAKIVGGSASLSLRNNADSADNVLIADGGAITARGTITANDFQASGASGSQIPLRLLNVGTVITGSSATLATSKFLMQAFTVVGTTDSGGHLTITYPTAFPNGIYSIVASPGDTAGGLIFVTPAIAANLTSVVVTCWTQSAGAVQVVNTMAVRVNVIAVGW